MHKLLLRQLNRICKNTEERLVENQNFEELLTFVSKTYEEYDDNVYILERALKLSCEELELLQLAQKKSYDSHTNAMVMAMPDMMFLNNEEGLFLEAFMKKKESLFLGKLEIIGNYYKDFFPKDLELFFHKNLKKSIQSKKLNVVEFRVEKGNQYYEARFMYADYQIEEKETVITIIRNISTQKKTEEKLKFIGLHDSLTKLPNRLYFQKKLKECLQKVKKDKMNGGLFFLDIDKFKMINDNLGHDTGDKVLLKITKRLQLIAGEKGFLARLGGDEFVLLVPNVSHFELEELANSIMEGFSRRPFKVEEHFLDITTSIGICTFSETTSANQLLKQADIAMYEAKDSGRNSYKFFTNELAEKAYEAFMIEVKLKKAIENNEFHLLYQPQIQLLNNKIVGVEALLRWKNENVLISPLKFIPIAESCGFIEKISDWIIEEVCQQLMFWKQEEIEVGSVAINLSGRELGKINLLPRISKIIEKYTITSSSIHFEVTETAMFANREIVFKNIQALRTKGFLIALDDFGTGYSSLSNLKESLFDKLKIDRSFIADIGRVNESEIIIKMTIAIARSLNLKVVAEGVESLEQLHFLEKYVCHEVQGYYYSHPLLSKDISHFYASFYPKVNNPYDYQI
ncbi:MAG: diguanylate cyclase/phosphodiesterase (GGDEF & EAL domains) with PAS/PAC sensor(s) [uncultured Sulfurovum sp.]|uniref:Diguanylate cyclase/phosphodiesterase (GGDEF & EAL domains) with PAS/PAC sensor(S) n=1 Tax=uncultured Sulfurovum sp. TaxID=269237 RepID=A0A6S6TMX0_9BACT|nr:MAG: diguanylate cyclase/phosphodiesterase (GGDEF & EAL domains) with PAS/PAC sensor(s) [uncultured Sulfurovum sp.]